jgi:sugar phosphate isomerase/epimerase
MKLGLSSYAYRWSIAVKGFTPTRPMKVQELLLRAAHHGLEGVQICDHTGFQNLGDDELEEIRRTAEDHHLFIETGAGSVEPEYLSRLVEVSRKLGAHLMRVIPGIDRQGGAAGMAAKIGEQLDRNAGVIRRILPQAKDAGVRLALENHAQINSGELRRLVEAIDDDRVGVCLDTMNSIVLMEHPIYTTEMLAPWTVCVHLKDFTIQPSPRGHWITGTPLGDGVVDFQRILQMMRESGRDPSVDIELFVDRKESEEENLTWEEHCVEKSVRYARNVLHL